MNTTITQMITAFEPQTFISYDIPIPTLIAKFNLSFAQAEVLHVLLREYKANAKNFSSRATRQHIYKVREKLRKHLKEYDYTIFFPRIWILQSEHIILSLGMGFYMISDPVKKIIKEYVEKQS